MNFILLLITFLSITSSNCGHIYIEDLSIEWQNQAYFNKITIPFNLENYLEKDEIIKIMLPLNMTSVTAQVIVFFVL